MATITVTPGYTYGATDTVTSTNLNDLGSPTAALTAGTIATADIADGAVTTAKIADSNVTTAKIADSNVTTAKIADSNVTFAKLTNVIDDDTMATATDTTLATSESIKTYVDGESSFNTSDGYQKLPGGLIIQFGHRTTDNVAGWTTTTFPTSFTTKCMFVNIVEEGGSHRNFNIRNIGLSSFESEAITAGSNEARYFAIGY